MTLPADAAGYPASVSRWDPVNAGRTRTRAVEGIVAAIGDQLLSVQLAVEQHQNDLLWRDARTLKYAPRLAEISDQIQVVREQMKAELDRQFVAGKDGTGNGVGDSGSVRPEKAARRSSVRRPPPTGLPGRPGEPDS